MSALAWLTLVVVVGTVAVLVTERVNPPLAVLGAVIVLLAAGVIDDSQALSGFSNPAPVTVAALYVVAGAVEATGALEGAGRRLLGQADAGGGGGGERTSRRELARLLVPTAAASAVLNNTPIVSMAAPRVAAWAERTGRLPSQFLMPLSFAAILGGVVTTIGTSTNLVVAGLLRDAGQPSLGLFEVTRLGLPVAVAGIGVMLATAPRLTARRRSSREELGAHAREFTIEMLLPPGSPLSGRSVTEAGLRNLEGVFLVEIERDGRLIAPVGPDEELAGGDRLVFVGNVGRILDLQRMSGLVPAEQRHFQVGPNSSQRFFQVVVTGGSALAGTTLKEAGFRGRYGGAVVALHRGGERVGAKLGEVPLRAGDVLLVLSDADFRRRWHDHRDFLVVSPAATDGPPRRGRARLTQLVILAVVVAAGTGAVDILQASLLAAVALVGLGALTPAEARASVDLDVVVLIAASFGLGAAISESGLAAELADLLVGAADRFGDLGLLGGVLVATTMLTALISNNAAAVLMFPIATAAAAQAGLDPRPFAIAVMLGASVDFLTPIGYQTNTMVYGMGGYHFGDFARLGAPLTATTLLVALAVIPLGWPLR
ncbi:MAG: SLC13 family permease [Acidimicrobiales bacterium]